MQERFQVRHVNTLTGTFVLLVVVALIATVVWTGRSQRWFKGNVTLLIVLPETGAKGIRQGSEVYFLGTLVGTVSDVRVDPAGRMEAEVGLRRDFFRFVRSDSSAVVRRKFGMVGDAYFEITRGEGQPLPEVNASIVCHEPLPSALEIAVEEIRSEAVPAFKQLSAGLGTWTALGSNLLSTQERIDQFVRRADGLAAGLQEGRGTVGKLLTDPAAADELARLLVQAHRSLGELQGTFQNFRVASGNLQRASIPLPAITDALGSEAEDLAGLVLQTQHTVYEIGRLVEGLERHWLIRKYIQPPQADTRIPSSEVAP